MSISKVAIIRTGSANLASVQAAFRRLEVSNRVIDSPAELNSDEAVALPGVGSFRSGIQSIDELGWKAVLRERFEQDLPTLAICLGLQLLGEESEESPQRSGLAIMPVKVSRIPENVAVPHFGWNQVVSRGPKDAKSVLTTDYFYFANSFCVQECGQLESAGWEVATTTHGVEFVAAARKGNWLACQFHPELSGRAGLKLLNQWIQFGDNAARKETGLC